MSDPIEHVEDVTVCDADDCEDPAIPGHELYWGGPRSMRYCRDCFRIYAIEQDRDAREAAGFSNLRRTRHE